MLWALGFRNHEEHRMVLRTDEGMVKNLGTVSEVRVRRWVEQPKVAELAGSCCSQRDEGVACLECSVGIVVWRCDRFQMGWVREGSTPEAKTTFPRQKKTLHRQKPKMVTKWLKNWSPGLIFSAKFAAHRARADDGGPEAPGNKFNLVFCCLSVFFCLGGHAPCELGAYVRRLRAHVNGGLGVPTGNGRLRPGGTSGGLCSLLFHRACLAAG